MSEFSPIHFYDQSIDVIFDVPPPLEKSPPCPDGFIWDGINYRVTALLSEWNDFKRRGRMARNMRPAHAAVAATRGSLNVGRFYFRVRAKPSKNVIVGEPGAKAAEADSRIFDLYYDRAMKSLDERKGSWFLYRELA
jgi:hypothetical protein